MKKSTANKINHDVADFKDRTRKTNKAETKVSNSLEDGLRSIPEVKAGVELHDKYEAIRQRNLEAYQSGDVTKMTHGFLVKMYRYEKDDRLFNLAKDELNRRDDIAREKEARFARDNEKKDLIQARNHDALSSAPKKFYAMTYGLLANIAKKDVEFLKRLEQNGYKFDAYDFVEAGFEVQRRLQDKEKKIAELGAYLEKLEAETPINKVEVEKTLYILEKLTQERTTQSGSNSESKGETVPVAETNENW